HGLEELLTGADLALDEVSDDLGVGVGSEFDALLGELALEVQVVLDDAVVHERDAARDVRVRVRLGRTAVRRPARVPDAERALERLVLQRRDEVAELAHAPQDAQVLAVVNGETGRVVTPVFETAKTVDEKLHTALRTDVTDDATHAPEAITLDRK